MFLNFKLVKYFKYGDIFDCCLYLCIKLELWEGESFIFNLVDI